MSFYQILQEVIQTDDRGSAPELVLFLLDTAEDGMKGESSSAALIKSAIEYKRDDLIDALYASGVHLHSKAHLTKDIAAAS